MFSSPWATLLAFVPFICGRPWCCLTSHVWGMSLLQDRHGLYPPHGLECGLEGQSRVGLADNTGIVSYIFWIPDMRPSASRKGNVLMLHTIYLWESHDYHNGHLIHKLRCGYGWLSSPQSLGRLSSIWHVIVWSMRTVFLEWKYFLWGATRASPRVGCIWAPYSGKHPIVSNFLCGDRWLTPICRQWVSSWNLVVLEGLLEAPFEPLESASE